MPETAQQWYARVNAEIEADGYRDTDLTQWKSWPWTGTLTPKPLDPPAAAEPQPSGVGGADCAQCAKSQDPGSDYLIWRDELWMLGMPFEPSSLPFKVFLMPRRHADLAGLTQREAARQGELLVAIEQAACSVLDVPRIQVARWGDGTEHLHWWLYARPTGQLQLRGTFLSHWDDLLPIGDPAAARADGELVAARLIELAGGELVQRTGSDSRSTDQPTA